MKLAFLPATLAALLASGASAGPNTYTYPVKSINLSSALKPEYYGAYSSDELSVGRTTDVHAVHGIQTSTGASVLVGKGDEAEGSQYSDAFAVGLSSTGAKVWGWGSNSANGDAANSVAELSSGDLLVAGWRTVGGIGKRSVTKLSSSGSELYTATDFGDSSASHGAYEMIVLDSSNNIYVTGLNKKSDLEEMAFKSYGNVPSGTAIIEKLPASAFGASAPTSSSVTWSREFSGYSTAKTAVPFGSDKVAVQLYGEDGGKSAAVVVLNANDGSIVWGPTNYGNDHGEGTDMTVSTDGSALIMVGHGTGSGEVGLSGRVSKISTSDGTRSWSKSFNVGGNANIIYNECWGVAALEDGTGFGVSCGAGIEGDKCDQLSGQDKSDCNAGIGDRRAGAKPRGKDDWQSFVFKIDGEGTLLWQRVDSYKCNNGCAANIDASGFDPSSSAAEWIFPGTGGDLGIVTDEVFGLGVLMLGTDGTEADTGRGGDSGGNEDEDEDEETNVDGGADKLGASLLGIFGLTLASAGVFAL
ncbi:hypothetical protein TrVE_jg1415 [Triparma verrucosa]|uniref:Uncharacterized protein n=1 Tax=Triparma verrucosa TaxID=1606542 RepID=A0A9W7CHA3_9STRA|nr:hypothetical protein TrVE_jg1415 [Triparma verrucosa]